MKLREWCEASGVGLNQDRDGRMFLVKPADGKSKGVGIGMLFRLDDFYVDGFDGSTFWFAERKQFERMLLDLKEQYKLAVEMLVRHKIITSEQAVSLYAEFVKKADPYERKEER